MKRITMLIGLIFGFITIKSQTISDIDNLIKLKNTAIYKAQDDEMWKLLKPIDKKSDSLEILGKKAMKNDDKEQIKSLMEQYKVCTREKLSVLSSHPDYVYSADYLLLLAMRERDKKNRAPKLGGLAEFITVYNKFSDSVKNSYYGKGLKLLFDSKMPSIGEDAPNIVLYSKKGDKINLSDYKGKYILLKTYISDCSGWANEVSKVQEAFEKFRTNNLVIIGIGIDENRNAWIDSLNTNKINWISTFQPIGGSVSILYNINSNSRNILINPEGKVVDMDIPIQSGQLIERIEIAMKK